MINLIKKTSSNKALFKCFKCSNEYFKDYYTAIKSKCGHLCHTCVNSVANMTEITQENLKKEFDYCPITGQFSQKYASRKHSAGGLPGYLGSHGYKVLLIGRKEYLLHRIIWLYQTGSWPSQVDHINHNRLDNSWNNLRNVTNLENCKNMSIKSNVNNITKTTGVRKLPGGKYWAYISVNYKQISLGSFTSLEEAKEARKLAEITYNFHKNHGK